MTRPVDVLVIAGISAVAAVLLHRFTREERVGGADEGYLWYGVQEIRRGHKPLLDFRSYEPGRYWWSVPFVALFPRELQAIRAGSTVFLGLTTFSLSFLVRTAGADWPAVIAVAVVPLVWASRPHKRFDQGTVLLIAAGAIDLIRDPDVGGMVVMGIVVAVALTMGANHGLYAAVVAGMSGLLVIRVSGVELGELLVWGALGFAGGVVPLVAFALMERGFVPTFLKRRFHEPRRRGSTNLPVPYPWVWTRRRVGGLGSASRGQTFVVRLLFTVIPVAAAGVVVVGFVSSTDWATDHAVLVGGAVTTLVCWHHVASRADMEHLATVVGVPLALVAAIATDSRLIAALLAAASVVLAVVVALPLHDRVLRWRHPERFARIDDSRAQGVWFRTSERQLVEACLDLDSSAPEAGPWLAVPMTMWILPIVHRRSAVYQTFCVYPASPEEQEEMLSQIAATHPRVAIVGTTALDGRDERRFSRTHPEVWDALRQDYVRDESAQTPGVEILRRADYVEADST